MGQKTKKNRQDDARNVIITRVNKGIGHIHGSIGTVHTGDVSGPVHHGSGRVINEPLHLGTGNVFELDDD